MDGGINECILNFYLYSMDTIKVVCFIEEKHGNYIKKKTKKKWLHCQNKQEI